MSKAPKTLKEWAAQKKGKHGNSRRGEAFEERIAGELRLQGYEVDVTELNRQMVMRRGRIGWVTKKADFFGCIDIIAVRPGSEVLFIQATLDDSESMARRKGAEMARVFVAQTPGRRILIVQPEEPAYEGGPRYRVRELQLDGSWSSRAEMTPSASGT
jgi:hypothetical protein